MAIIPTQTDFDIINQPIQNRKIRIELLDFYFRIVDTIEGETIGGTITIDANQDIRRICNLSLVVRDSSFSIQEGGKIWLDKYVKVYIGIDNIRTKETVWWNMGIFLINNPSREFDAVTNTLSFEGLDLMSKLTGKRNGQLTGIITLIPAGTLIAEAVKVIITQLGGFTNYIIQDKGYTVPYDIKIDSAGYVYNLLTELRDLYANWEMFFDVNGVFYFQEIPDGINSPIIIDLDSLKKQVVVKENTDISFENVKNSITIYGRLLDDGTQIKSYIAEYRKQSPYQIDKIGKIDYVIPDERIYTNELAAERARYELYLHSQLNDNLVLNLLPIFWLNDVNFKLKYTNSETGVSGNALVKQITLPLDIQSQMSITAMKIYDPETEPKPIVSLSPISVDVDAESQLILYANVSDDFEEFNVDEGDLNWTYPSGYTIGDFLTLVKVSNIDSQTIKLRYDVNMPVPGWQVSANLTSQVKSGAAYNLYGFENNPSNISNINIKAFPAPIRINFGPVWSQNLLVGSTFTIYANVVYDYSYVVPVAPLSADSLIYDKSMIQINSVSLSSGPYYKVVISGQVINSGTAYINVKNGILKDNFDYLNDGTKNPYYITGYTSSDLVVTIPAEFTYQNITSSPPTFRLNCLTASDVDDFEITREDLEFDDYYFDFDYATKISNNQIYLYFKNINTTNIDNNLGDTTVRVKAGVAHRNNIPSLPSNIGVCVGGGLG